MISEEIKPFTTTISYKSVLYGLVGAVFFGTIAYLLFTSDIKVAKGTDQETAEVFIWGLKALFVFFALWSLISAFNTKIYQLQLEELVIIKPLLFHKTAHHLSAISRLNEEDFKINPSSGGSRINVYEGKQLVIELRNGKKMKLNSFEVKEYMGFRNKLAIMCRSHQVRIDVGRSRVESGAYSGWGWLLFAILLTIGLVISVLTSNA